MFSKRIDYIDRIHIWLDTNRSVFDQNTIKAIASDGTRIKVEIKPMSDFQPEWRQKIELLQPTKKALKIIDDTIAAAQCGYIVNRIELTVDYLTKNQDNADVLHAHIAQSLFHKSGKKYHYSNDYKTWKRPGTSYFADQTKHKVIPVVYSSKRSKIAKKPCCHIEYRFIGKTACARKGFTTIRHLLDCDIVETIKENVSFDKRPSKHEIGMAVRVKQDGSITRRGYEKLCDSFWKKRRTRLEGMMDGHTEEDISVADKYP